MVRFIILVLLITGFTTLVKRDFRIVEATRQEWTGGRQKSARGLNYRVTIIAGKGSGKLKLQELWVNRKLIPHRVFNLTKNEPGVSFAKKDTLVITGTVIINESISSDSIYKEPPFIFTEELIIGYKLNNRMLYKPVSEIKILDPLYHK
jgi:hypothetical protein